MRSDNQNKISRQKLAIIITAVMTAAAVILLVVMIVTHADPTLTKIEIASPPYKTEYIEKQTLDTAGLVVKAYYGDKAVEVSDYVVDKTVLEYGDDKINVSYTDHKKTETASFGISVIKRSLKSIEVTKQPDKTVYFEGTLFDPSGTEVTAHYDNGESAVITDWEYSPSKALSPSDSVITVSFGGMTTSIPITVEQKQLQEIYLDSLPNKLKYTVGEYFDFLGLELYAKHNNAPIERVYNWELDVKRPLTVGDTSIRVSYTLHGITKSLVIDIEVVEAERISDEQKIITELINLLPPVGRLGVDNLGALNYVLSILDEAEITEEQRSLKDELSAARDEITAAMPEEPEKEYNIKYGIGGGLEFADINYGSNPVKIKEGQSIELQAAVSAIAEDRGYVFTGWVMDGKTVTNISKIDADKTVYAVFTLTPTVKLVFKDKESNEELYTANPLRTDNYNFDDANIPSAIIDRKGVLPIAYYSVDNKRINDIDLNVGSSVTVYVMTAALREMHLPNENLFTVGWKHEFTVGEETDETVAVSKTGSVFYIPIGAEVTITSTNANIDSIALDGADIGTRLNNFVVYAVFTMEHAEYPAAVTYTTKLSDMTTLSFVGQNVHSVVYPAGWNGIMAEIDLNNLAFIFDEYNNRYLNTYRIKNIEYYFDDLSSYVFDGDTVITVSKQRNSFSLTIIYTNGKETIDDIEGRRTLASAISAFSDDAMSTLNTILDMSNLFTDKAMTAPIAKDELLSTVIRRNILVYSDWEFVSPQPTIPNFDPVDYADYSFVNSWSALFTDESDILSCELVLTADGNYSYTTFVNGLVSAHAYGVYRLNNGKVELKTFVSTHKYDNFTFEDLSVDISFSADGLLITKFVRIEGTQKTVFEQVLFCGSVRPINYSATPYIGSYNIGGITISLLENGVAIINVAEETITAYYRINGEGRVYLMGNGSVGTGDITEILEGYLL